MRIVALVLCAWLMATPLDARAIKVIEPLPAGLPGAVHVTGVTVTVAEAARQTFEALEQKAVQKRDATGDAAPASAGARPNRDRYATLPFAQMLPLVIDDAMAAHGLTGGRAVRLQMTVDTLKTANAGMAMLLGSFDELAGLVEVDDAGDGRKLGEFYVDVLNSRSGLLGLAMRGAGVREKLADEFAKHVAEVLGGTKGHPTVAPVVAAGQIGESGKTITYPIEPDILAKTPAQTGLTLSPAPVRGPDDILLTVAPGVDALVVRASEMGGGNAMLNPLSTLLREQFALRDVDGILGDATPGVPTLAVTVDRAATLIRCVTTGELKGTCIVRVTLAGSVARGSSPPKPFDMAIDKSVRGVMPSHGVALVSREAALQLVALAASS